MEQCGRDLNSWDKLVEKATDAETKVSQLVAILREMDQRYPRDNWPAHTTAAKPCRPPPVGTLETSRLGRFRPRISLHVPHTEFPRGPRMLAKPPTKKLGRRRKSSAISTRLRTPEPKPPVPTLPMSQTFLKRVEKTRAEQPATIATRRDTISEPGKAKDALPKNSNSC